MIFKILIFLTCLGLMIKQPLSKEIDYSHLEYKNELFYDLSGGRPYTGLVTGRIEARLVEGVFNGPYRQYYANGRLRLQGVYSEGKKEGVWSSFHKNGQLHSKGLYRKGLWEGPWVDYYDDGSIRSKMHYRNGKEIKR